MNIASRPISLISALILGLVSMLVSAGGYGNSAYYGGMQAMYPSSGYAYGYQIPHHYTIGGARGLYSGGFSLGFNQIFYYSKLQLIVWSYIRMQIVYHPTWWWQLCMIALWPVVNVHAVAKAKAFTNINCFVFEIQLKSRLQLIIQQNQELDGSISTW